MPKIIFRHALLVNMNSIDEYDLSLAFKCYSYCLLPVVYSPGDNDIDKDLVENLDHIRFSKCILNRLHPHTNPNEVEIEKIQEILSIICRLSKRVRLCTNSSCIKNYL